MFTIHKPTAAKNGLWKYGLSFDQKKAKTKYAPKYKIAALATIKFSTSAKTGRIANTDRATASGTNTAPMYRHRKMLTLIKRTGPSHIAPFYATRLRLTPVLPFVTMGDVPAGLWRSWERA